MKKKYFWFSFILVAFVLTAHSTWAYFKDSRELKTAFSSSVRYMSPELTIPSRTFDPDHGITTLTVTFEKNSSLPWNKDTVHLEIGTPYIDGTDQNLNNLFGANNSGENSYYKISGLDKPTSIDDSEAQFKITVDYSNDYSKSLQIRLGVEKIRFDIKGVAQSLQGVSLNVHDANDYLQINTTPWEWPTNGNFRNDTTYKVVDYDPETQKVTKKSLLYDNLDINYRNNYKELHTPVYYGPSHISTDPDNSAYSKNVFPSLRFVSDNIGLFDKDTLSYSEQYHRATQYFPNWVCYQDDLRYFLIRGPVYYIPGKGFIGLYYMTWYKPYNDYGATNKVFKQLYIYKNQYKSIKFTEQSRNIVVEYYDWWGQLQSKTASQYKYQLEPIDSNILPYVKRFVDKLTVESPNSDVLKATYQDYSNIAIGASSQNRPKFQIGEDIYQGPDYVHEALGSVSGRSYVYLCDEDNNIIYSRTK